MLSDLGSVAQVGVQMADFNQPQPAARYVDDPFGQTAGAVAISGG